MNIANLAALKAHVPDAEEIFKLFEKKDIKKEVPQELDPLPEGLSEVDIVCKEGVSFVFYETLKPWLHAKAERRLFLIEADLSSFAQLAQEESALSLLKDSQVRLFFIQNAIQAEFAIKKIAWMAVFKKLKVLDSAYKEKIEEIHQAAHLIASDAADFGSLVARHLKVNFRSPMRSLASLEGSMQNTPAIIIGAGPSLEKNGQLLEMFQDKALLIAAGSAMNMVKARPDLAVALDPHEALERTRYFDVPLCMQARVHPKTRRSVKGELIYFSDSHYAFERWLTDGSPLNGGWTVGNAAVSIAIALGCNPIVLVGMDYCYRGKQKYAHNQAQDHLKATSALDASGAPVLTQSDWLMAISWMEQMASKHLEISFFNATAEGMLIKSPFRPLQLSDFKVDAVGVLEKWKKALQSASWIELKQEKLLAWKESLQRCKVEESEDLCKNSLQNEIAYQILLEPLWQIWAPMFERELMMDPHQLAMEDKLIIQKHLFFNQVIEEHLRAL